MMAARRLGQLVPRSSVMFLCDMQEKFRHNVAFFPQIVNVAARMLQVMRLIEVPVVVTEQYPEGLGPTVSELNIAGLPKFTKTCFSMVTPEVLQELTGIGNIRSVVLCGIEAQACISGLTRKWPRGVRSSILDPDVQPG
uniref:isochorismatase domain-containing protein 2-like n=1 Tax=Myxine glutinosa TaxID=7769 RepID=UPI00358F54A1